MDSPEDKRLYLVSQYPAVTAPWQGMGMLGACMACPRACLGSIGTKGLRSK